MLQYFIILFEKFVWNNYFTDKYKLGGGDVINWITFYDNEGVSLGNVGATPWDEYVASICFTESRFYRNYTKLSGLAFLYCSIVKCNINSAKSLPPMGIESATLGLWHLICVRSQALTRFTWQVLFEGYLTSLVLVQLTFRHRWFSWNQ